MPAEASVVASSTLDCDCFKNVATSKMVKITFDAQ